MLRILVTYIFLCFAQQAHALFIDFGSNLSLGNFNYTTAQTNNKTFTNAGLFANLSKAEYTARVQIGWYLLSYSGQENFPGSITQTLNSNDMGPALRWSIDRRGRFSVTAVYGVICKGTLSDGTTSESLSGESLLIKFTIEPDVSERFFIGGALNYYSASYKTSVIGTTQSNVNYQNNYIFPSLSLSYRY